MTGRLLFPAEAVAADRAGWLAMRRDLITGTDIPSLLGISSWSSPYALFHAKISGLETGDKPAMARGRHLEPVIDDMLYAERPELAVCTGGLYCAADLPWAGGTLDRLIIDTEAAPAAAVDLFRNYDAARAGEHVAVGEYKTWATKDGWGEPPDGHIPAPVRAQTLWNARVYGATRAYVVVLWMMQWQIGVYELDIPAGPGVAADLDFMEHEANLFRLRLASLDEPPVDAHVATTETLRKLHPSLTDTEVIVPRKLARRYMAARAAEARAKARVRGAQNELRARMGSAARAVAYEGDPATVNGARLVKVCSRYVGDADVKAHSRHDDRLNPGRWAP